MVNPEVARETGKAAGIVGILILLCGIIDCICGFIWVGYGAPGGHGLWSGFGLITVGVLGIIVMIKLNKMVLVFYMAICIVMIIISGIQAIIAGLAYLIWNIVLAASDCRVWTGRGCVCQNHNTPFTLENCDDIRVIDATLLCVTIVSALGAILTLAGSIIGCTGVCCGGPPQGGAVVVQQPVMLATTTTYPGGQYPAPVQYPPGQYPAQYPAGQYPPQYSAEPQNPPPVATGQAGYPMADLPPKV